MAPLKQTNPPKQSGGFTLIEMVIAVAIFAVVMLAVSRGLQTTVNRQTITRTTTGFNAIIEALYSYRIETGEGGVPSWPADIDELATSGYLPIWNNVNGVGFPYVLSAAPVGAGVIITTDLLSAEQTLEVSLEFGAIAETTLGTAPSGDATFSVAVGVGIPGTESAHLALLDRAGTRSVQGSLEFDPNAHINLQGNNIENAGEIEVTSQISVTNSSGTAVIFADNGEITSLTTDTLRVNP